MTYLNYAQIKEATLLGHEMELVAFTQFCDVVSGDPVPDNVVSIAEYWLAMMKILWLAPEFRHVWFDLADCGTQVWPVPAVQSRRHLGSKGEDHLLSVCNHAWGVFSLFLVRCPSLYPQIVANKFSFIIKFVWFVSYICFFAAYGMTIIDQVRVFDDNVVVFKWFRWFADGGHANGELSCPLGSAALFHSISRDRYASNRQEHLIFVLDYIRKHG